MISGSASMASGSDLNRSVAQTKCSSNSEVHTTSKYDGTEYPCAQCDYIATRKNTLKMHIKAKHEGIKYPCDQCEYVATKSIILKTNTQTIGA